ncbi:hypothetical protein Q4E93_22045 [Flavitalea sp. BT771]|nr:hypothetical protein [Flavitalea sp. BT771]MDO6433309.1 hypothetical protein [Flavitalea sp. BT771]MDV6222786.1 hypothetical protein [Flavitalea sp. BT771]
MPCTLPLLVLYGITTFELRPLMQRYTETARAIIFTNQNKRNE